MKKIILHGGGIGQDEKGKQFWRELMGDGKRLLVVPFASPLINNLDDEKKPRFSRYVFFNSIVNRFNLRRTIWYDVFTATNTGIGVMVARDRRFQDQLRWADSIYFTGGTTQLLLEKLRGQTGWTKLLDGKIIAGESAGANALSTYCYGLDARQFLVGTCVAPVKVIIHFGSNYLGPNFNWKKLYRQMRDNIGPPSMPIYPLCEGEYQILEA